MNRRDAVSPLVSGLFDPAICLPDSCCHNHRNRDLQRGNTAADVAGKRIIVGSGTNQEAILLRWDEENKAKGLKAVEFQYYDDDSASNLALQSGRADLTFGPNATAAQAGLNHLIEDGTYAKILDRWGLSSEAVAKSELNPAGLPSK